jgi:hypothetical protein
MSQLSSMLGHLSTILSHLSSLLSQVSYFAFLFCRRLLVPVSYVHKWIYVLIASNNLPHKYVLRQENYYYVFLPDCPHSLTPWPAVWNNWIIGTLIHEHNEVSHY